MPSSTVENPTNKTKPDYVCLYMMINDGFAKVKVINHGETGANQVVNVAKSYNFADGTPPVLSFGTLRVSVY